MNTLADRLELAAKIAREGLPWEYEFQNSWHPGENILTSVSFPIRIKEDPFAELKKAHAEGKMIQYQTIDETWEDCSTPVWLPESNYRIKPEPKLVPLDPEDVTPGSVIRHMNATEWNWYSVVSIHRCNIALGSFNGNLGTDAPTYHQLIDCLILRPGSTEWIPCSKEVEA